MSCKAVILDYIGTLVNCRNYSMEASEDNLYWALLSEGFDINKGSFLQEYEKAHQKYRKIRYTQYREVTNAIWVSEALCSLGFEVAADDCRIQTALAAFFKDFIISLQIRQGAKTLIKKAAQQGKVGLISNFTYAPVIYKSLRHLRLNELFQTVLVSEEFGWRKPSSLIFKETLAKLQVQPHEAIFIGDSPIEDIKGAKEAGLKTVFVSSQFYSFNDLRESGQKPDFAAQELKSVSENLTQILSQPKEDDKFGKSANCKIGFQNFCQKASAHKFFIHP